MKTKENAELETEFEQTKRSLLQGQFIFDGTMEAILDEPIEGVNNRIEHAIELDRITGRSGYRKQARVGGRPGLTDDD